MSVNGPFRSTQSQPPQIRLLVGATSYDFKLFVPRAGIGDVQGFSAGTVDYLEQAEVDRAVAALQEFLAAAPAEHQAVYTALLDQAAEAADAGWPAP